MTRTDRGKAISALVPVYACRCARCGEDFESRCNCLPIVEPVPLALVAAMMVPVPFHRADCKPPDRCGVPSCRARTWDQRKPRRAGRPKLAKGA